MKFEMNIYPLTRKVPSDRGYEVSYDVISIEDLEFERLHTILLKRGKLAAHRYGPKSEMLPTVFESIDEISRERKLTSKDPKRLTFELAEGANGNYVLADSDSKLYGELVQHFGLDDEIQTVFNDIAHQSLRDHKLIESLFKRKERQPAYTNFGDWA